MLVVMATHPRYMARPALAEVSAQGSRHCRGRFGEETTICQLPEECERHCQISCNVDRSYSPHWRDLLTLHLQLDARASKTSHDKARGLFD
jgi:hypothetical protein